MATSSVVCASVLSFLFHFLLVPVFSHDVNVLQNCGFKAIYQLGDSISDTGNLIRENPLSPYAWFPYGMNLSKPTGRCSNGLLMIDFIGKFRYSLFPVCLPGNATFQIVFDLKKHVYACLSQMQLNHVSLNPHNNAIIKKI